MFDGGKMFDSHKGSKLISTALYKGVFKTSTLMKSLWVYHLEYK